MYVQVVQCFAMLVTTRTMRTINTIPAYVLYDTYVTNKHPPRRKISPDHFKKNRSGSATPQHDINEEVLLKVIRSCKVAEPIQG